MNVGVLLLAIGNAISHTVNSISFCLQSSCAALIQQNFRGYRSRMKFHYDLYRITLVQSIWRKTLAMRAFHVMLRHHYARYSDDSHQPCDYGKTTNEQAKAQQKPNKQTTASLEFLQPSGEEEAGIWYVGAIIIQTYWRSYVSRVCYLQSLCDVVVVQGVARGWLTRRWLDRSSSTSGKNKQERNPFARLQQSSVARNAARFSKIGSFESRNLSSSGAEESSGSSNRSIAGSDPKQTRGHFDDPSRFRGQNNVWDRSAIMANRNVSGNSQGGKSFHKVPGNNWNKPGNPQARSSPAGIGEQQGLPIGQPKEVPRSKGWNAQEEIDKQGTRNLLMAWKQKDKANTFTIKPRPGH